MGKSLSARREPVGVEGVKVGRQGVGRDLPGSALKGKSGEGHEGREWRGGCS